MYPSTTPTACPPRGPGAWGGILSGGEILTEGTGGRYYQGGVLTEGGSRATGVVYMEWYREGI